MSKKKKRQKDRQKQQKRTAAGAAKERKRQHPQRRGASPLAAYSPANLPDQQMLVRGMVEMESLAEEPEFDGFKLGKDAFEIAANMIADSDKEMGRLEEIGDEAGIERLVAEAKMETIAQVVTPAVRVDVRRRLERLSRRLREEGQKQRAESLAALLPMLDWPLFPWALFEPVHRAFEDVLEQSFSLALLYKALAKAAGRPIKDIGPDEWQSLLQDPEIVRRFEAEYKDDEAFQKMLENQIQKIEGAFADSLFQDRVDLGLFDDEELAVGLAWYERECGQAADERGEDEDAKSDGRPQPTIRATASALSYLNTPARRQRWLERLERLEPQEHWPSEIEDGLRLLKEMLAVPGQPEQPEHPLVAVYLVEMVRMSRRLQVDSSENEEQEERIREIQARLDRGEPPLP
jgi:hypothetical protein